MLAVKRSWRLVYYSLLCNLLTNPAVNFFLLLIVGQLGMGLYWPSFIFLEIAVVFTEALVYRGLCGYGFARALGLSALLNAVSCLLGLFISQFI